MMIRTFNEAESLRAEIAALAARFIAEDGADYGSAKRRAAKQILGNQKVRGDIMPDNQQIEDEVREYNAIFYSDSQPERLQHLREIALELMQVLERFHPYLVGAVMNGTANTHSDIHLHLFTDNGKEVAIFLLNKDIQFEVSENTQQRRGDPIETLSFMYKNEGVHLTLLTHDDLKSGGRHERLSPQALATLLEEQGNEEQS